MEEQEAAKTLFDMDLSVHAKELARKGAARGGKARAAQQTPEQRKQLARQAAIARWTRPPADDSPVVSVPQATFGSSDSPLRLGGMEIPCYVIPQGENEKGEPKVARVLMMGGMLKALNISLGGSSGRLSGSRLSRFVASKALQPFLSQELVAKVNNPILFKTPTGSTISYGYEADTLMGLCDVVLEARRAKHLNRQQEHIAEQCEILVRGWARVGLAAMIDEATGYQYYRARHDLEDILNR